MARHAARERQPAAQAAGRSASIECSIFAAGGGRGTELPLEGAKNPKANSARAAERRDRDRSRRVPLFRMRPAYRRLKRRRRGRTNDAGRVDSHGELIVAESTRGA